MSECMRICSYLNFSFDHEYLNLNIKLSTTKKIYIRVYEFLLVVVHKLCPLPGVVTAEYFGWKVILCSVVVFRASACYRFPIAKTWNRFGLSQKSSSYVWIWGVNRTVVIT